MATGNNFLDSLMDMAADTGNFDTDALKGFTDTLKSEIPHPHDTLEAIGESISDIGALTIGFLYGPIFIIAVIIIWILVPLSILTWQMALLATVAVALVLYVSYLLYTSSMKREIAESGQRIENTARAYTWNLSGSIMTVLGNATNEYSRIKRAKNPIDVASEKESLYESEIFD